jgi:hypothetical protein
MAQTFIVLISPDWLSGEPETGDSLADALDTIHSLHWRQGWGADQRVLDKLGGYSVYEMEGQGTLKLRGTYAELIAKLCPKHLPCTRD